MYLVGVIVLGAGRPCGHLTSHWRPSLPPSCPSPTPAPRPPSLFPLPTLASSLLLGLCRVAVRKRLACRSTSDRRTSCRRKVGFVGLGAMGAPMALNLIAIGHELTVFDLNEAAVQALVAKGATAAASPKEAAEGAAAVFTMVPNDKILRDVVTQPSTGLLHSLKGVHISCSTIHPDTARELAALHASHGSEYVGAPIFARADGVAARLASFVVGGADAAIDRVMPLLEANSNGVFRFGPDAGAGNVVKLCGNYMIASAIESCAEALSLAENSGLDRLAVMSMLNTTIFDCLIYKGYGNRVAQRSHVPGEALVGPGFQLDLGLKDVMLALDVAHKVRSPMPFGSVLHDRFLAASAKGRGSMDWSAIALSVSEDAGIDVSNFIPVGNGKRRKVA